MKPLTSSIIFETTAPLALVWDVITDNEHVTWRSDLDHIEIRDETTFVEYGKQGSIITFTITEKVLHHKYCFSMVHDKWVGTWEGCFFQKDGKTMVTFTEQLQMHAPFMQFIATLLMPIKKMQAQYCRDLAAYLKQFEQRGE